MVETHSASTPWEALRANAKAVFVGRVSCQESYTSEPKSKSSYFGGEGDCLDVDECEEGALCTNGGSCRNIPGSYICQCPQGYYSHGVQCLGRPPNELCSALMPIFFSTDIDECGEAKGSSLRAKCDRHASCYNTEGNYSCVCDHGYTGTPSDSAMGSGKGTGRSGRRRMEVRGRGRVLWELHVRGAREMRQQTRRVPVPLPRRLSTRPHPTTARVGLLKWRGERERMERADVDECEELAGCEDVEGSECHNTQGSFVCTCQPGFVLRDNTCVGKSSITFLATLRPGLSQDEDECASNPCKEGMKCINTQGSYECSCGRGYVQRNGTCEGWQNAAVA